MVHVQQVIYKVETYGQGILSTKDQNGNLIDMSKNILLENIECIKLGIQAPPGTEVIINNSKEILIGQSGIYEIDDLILGRNKITSLKFKHPEKLKNIIVDYLYTERR